MIKKSVWVGVALLLLTLALFGLWLGLHQPPTDAAPTLAVSENASLTSYSAEPIQPIPEPPKLDPLKVELGERLFRDPRLSGDGSIACATCHIPGQAFTDHQAKSRRFGGKLTDFNTPTLLNVTLNFRLFWDGRATHLEEQLAKSLDIGANWAQTVRLLKTDKELAPRFARAYSQGMTEATLQDAIAQFERTLLTPNARFDRYLRGDQNAITQTEKEGYFLFKSYGCASCHQGANVGGNMFQKLGIMRDYFAEHGPLLAADMGRYNISQREQDRHVFRVPSLRNIALTAPYLHDGSAKNLRDAVSIMGIYQLGRDIPAQDLNRLIAFLHTLSGEYQGQVLDQVVTP